MFGGLSMTELVVILVVALLVFGPGRLPQMGKAIGSTIRELKSSLSEAVERPAEVSKQPEK